MAQDLINQGRRYDKKATGIPDLTIAVMLCLMSDGDREMLCLFSNVWCLLTRPLRSYDGNCLRHPAVHPSNTAAAPAVCCAQFVTSSCCEQLAWEVTIGCMMKRRSTNSHRSTPKVWANPEKISPMSVDVPGAYDVERATMWRTGLMQNIGRGQVHKQLSCATPNAVLCGQAQAKMYRIHAVRLPVQAAKCTQRGAPEVPGQHHALAWHLEF